MKFSPILIGTLVGAMVGMILSQSKENLQVGGNLTWLENDRGNPNYKNYPPCYDICGATRKIQDILDKHGLTQKYQKMLELYSLVLCQEVYLKTKKCENTMLDERINDLNRIGSVSVIQRDREIVRNSIENLPSSMEMLYFLEKTTAELENIIPEIKQESIDAKDIETIVKMNTVFYEVHYPVLAENC